VIYEVISNLWMKRKSLCDRIDKGVKMENLRKKIDEIDDLMRQLFVSRMDVVKEIAIYKKNHGLTIENLEREQMIHQRSDICDPVVNDLYHQFINDLMKISKQYQDSIIKGD